MKMYKVTIPKNVVKSTSSKIDRVCITPCVDNYDDFEDWMRLVIDTLEINQIRRVMLTGNFSL